MRNALRGGREYDLRVISEDGALCTGAAPATWASCMKPAAGVLILILIELHAAMKNCLCIG